MKIWNIIKYGLALAVGGSMMGLNTIQYLGLCLFMYAASRVFLIEVKGDEDAPL